MGSTEVRLPPDTTSPWRARRLVAESLADETSAQVTEIVTLLVSEMVTNAVLHARTEVHLSIELVEAGIRVEVADGSPSAPALRHFTQQAATGRGMQLVEQLADRWGTENRPPGKVVWFEVADA